MGPLHGVRVIELAGLGPCPTAGMFLADLGAEVILVDRKTANVNAMDFGVEKKNNAEFYKRGKRSIAVDLKQQQGVELVLSLVESADIVIEGFRPGVVDRLGLGPEACCERNPSLIYGHLTGWGQTGPLAQVAGHDLNFSALSGGVHYTGEAGDTPFPAATVMGDVSGGALSFVLGLVAALFHKQKTGEGQVIDAAICDGAAYNMSLLASLKAMGALDDERGNDWASAGAPWSSAYVCADGKYITVQAAEPNFYTELLDKCGLSDDPDFAKQHDKRAWPRAKEKLAALFASQSRSHWCDLLEGTEACFAPVLNLSEAAEHPHNQARKNFINVNGLVQPAPAPKFSKTPHKVGIISASGEDTLAILQELGVPVDKVENLLTEGIV